MSFSHMRATRGVAILPAIVLAAVLGAVALGIQTLQSQNADVRGLTASLGNSATEVVKPVSSASTQAAKPSNAQPTYKEVCKAGYVYYVSIKGSTVFIKPGDIAAQLNVTRANVPLSFETKELAANGVVTAGKAQAIKCDFNEFQKEGSKCSRIAVGTDKGSMDGECNTAAEIRYGYDRISASCPGNGSIGNGVDIYVKDGKTVVKQCQPGATTDGSSSANAAAGGSSGTPTASDVGKSNLPQECQADSKSEACAKATAPEPTKCDPNSRDVVCYNQMLQDGRVSTNEKCSIGGSDISCNKEKQEYYVNEQEKQKLSSDFSCSDSAGSNGLYTCKYTVTAMPKPNPLTPTDGTKPAVPGPTVPNGPIVQQPTPPQGGGSQPSGSGYGGMGGGSTFGGGGMGGGGSSGGGGSNNGNNCSLISSMFGCSNTQASCQINASPNSVQRGQPVTISWQVSGQATAAQIMGVGSVPPYGSQTVYPTASMQYSMMVYDQRGSSNTCSTYVNVNNSGNSSCTSQPPQPTSPCTNGSWQPTYSSVNGVQCITGWRCGSANGPSANISCEPKVGDVGMSVAISYSCTGATTSSGSGFSTGGQLSGSVSAPITKPASGSNTTYTLTCNNGSATASAQCAVQVNQPSITLVANPARVQSGQTSVIGWVTSGMKACTVSSPDQADFTSRNSTYQNVNGSAATSPITASSTTFRLHCTTLSGGTRDATTVVVIGNAAAAQDITVSSSKDGGTVNHGDSVTIKWSLSQASSSAAMSLWLVDFNTEQAIALIASGKGASGTYAWSVPKTGDACDQSKPYVCASDLVTGHTYGIEAGYYTPTNAFLGGYPVPTDAIQPTYIDIGYTPDAFQVGE